MALECKGILNPLTGVCVEKNGQSPTTAANPSAKTSHPKTVRLDDYQLGPYCTFMKNFNQNTALTELAYAYDAVFDAVEKVDQHTTRHLAEAVGLDDTFGLATATSYGVVSGANLRGLWKGGRPITPASVTRAITVDAWEYSRGVGGWFQPLKMAVMVQLMLSGFFSSPDAVMDNDWVGGKDWSGPERKAAYRGTFLGEMAVALSMFAKEYSKTFNERRISRLAKWLWTGGWAAYTGYMYGRTDQREYFRLNGEDPELGDKPWNWTWDGYNPNRYSSDWASSYIGGAMFWAAGPRVGRRLADKIYEKVGMPDYYNTGFKFSRTEKDALLTVRDRTYLAESSLRRDIAGFRIGKLFRRLWIGAKTVGRIFRTAGLKRYGYAGMLTSASTLIVSIPVARVEQKGRKIEEDEVGAAKDKNVCSYQSSATLHGVSNRTLLSAFANAAFFLPFRLAGFDPSMFLYFAPGMALNVYPANSCNEYRGVPNQMALVHLERFRQAVTHSQKAHERALFQFNFALANREDQEKAIQKYTDPSYPQEVRELFKPFGARRPG